jgi:hypothetical protein
MNLQNARCNNRNILHYFSSADNRTAFPELILYINSQLITLRARTVPP